MSISSAMSGMVSGGKSGGIAASMGKMPPKMPEMGKKMAGDEGGDVPAHLTELHEKMGGKHMHVHSDGMSHTSHQVGDSGKVEGPHDHENLEALKDHIDRFFTEEEQESPSSDDTDEGLM